MDLLQRQLQNAEPDPNLNESEILRHCLSLDRAARASGNEMADGGTDVADLLQSAYALIRDAPHHLRPQLLAAQLLERSRRRDNMRETWGGICARFPNCHMAHRLHLRWLGRENRDNEALHIVEAKTPPPGAERAELSEFADLVFELRQTDARDVLFERLLERDPSNIRIRVLYGKTLFSRGNLTHALRVLDTLRDGKMTDAAQNVLDQSTQAFDALTRIGEAEMVTGKPAVLRSALSLFKNRVPRPLDPERLGGVVFFTGGLGAGGAERQMVKIASALHRRTVTGRRVSGIWVDGPVEVVVNSLDPARGKDFHLHSLTAAGVPVHVTEDMRPDMPPLADNLAVLEPLIPLLPRNAAYGVERLARLFRAHAPDVVYLWQDGAVLTGALAALIAGVPQIALSLRGLPPNLRPHLMKDSYQDLYRGLAEVPGVSFSSNSAAARKEYADWIGIKADKISVIRNAVTPFTANATAQSENSWSAFDARTRDARFTLGSVFRFTPNKRGLLWVDWAARLLRRQPDLRFILLGDGEQLDAARQLAQRLGVAHRFHFTGATSDVGFWLSKLDLFALLSENEGLPNVLIEAQLAGLPVISTPAGGAGETFLHGQSGTLLSSAAEPSFEEFEAAVLRILGDPQARAKMGATAQTNAAKNHDPDRILAQTMSLFYDRAIDGDTTGSRATPHRRANLTPNSRFDKRVQEAYNQLSGSPGR